MFPGDLDLEKIGFAAKVLRNDATGSKSIYMSSDKEKGFSRPQNIMFQACAPDAPLESQYDLSKPQQGNMSRWSLDVDVRPDTDLHKFLLGLNERAREELRSRAAECFPRMKTEKMSDDQLNMAWTNLYKADTPGQPGRFKVKVIMPPSEEEVARLTAISMEALERRKKDTTEVYEVTKFEPPSAKHPDGIFEYEPADAVTVLKAGCKVMPMVTTNGIWLNDSSCGISFVAKSVCVWPPAADAGIAAFNLGGVKTATLAGSKRARDDAEDYDFSDDAFLTAAAASLEPAPAAAPMDLSAGESSEVKAE